MDKSPYIRSRWFEDIPVGEFHVFGSYTFSEKEEGCRTVFLGNLSWSVEVHLLVINGGIIYGDFV